MRGAWQEAGRKKSARRKAVARIVACQAVIRTISAEDSDVVLIVRPTTDGSFSARPVGGSDEAELALVGPLLKTSIGGLVVGTNRMPRKSAWIVNSRSWKYWFAALSSSNNVHLLSGIQTFDRLPPTIRLPRLRQAGSYGVSGPAQGLHEGLTAVVCHASSMAVYFLHRRMDFPKPIALIVLQYMFACGT
jgi:hypothetical protein